MEYLGLYDENGICTDEKIKRSQKQLVPKGRFVRTMIIFMQNSQNKFLIQKVSPEKGGVYATTGGHVKAGMTSLETVSSELLEELGYSVILEEVTLFRTEKHRFGFQDAYYLKKDIDLKTLKLQVEEVASVQWMSIEEIVVLIKNGTFRKGNIESFLTLIQNIK